MFPLAAYLSEKVPSIFLLRHGHIDAGEQKRYIGQTDYPLSVLGQEQAEKWQHILKEVTFSQIITSELQRTRDTAMIIASGRQQEIKVIKGLDEINLGEWENLTFQHIKNNRLKEFQERDNNLATFRPPGGESFADMQKRVLESFLPLLKDIKGHILIVGHAGVNRVILCYLMGMPLKNLFNIAQDYSALNIIVRHLPGMV